ncbi:MAG: AMP-binding enzyme, partial [Phycisphaerales bacterium]
RALLRHPAVRHVAVVPAPDVRLGELCCAFVVPRGDLPSLEDLRGYLRKEGLASFKLPERLEIVDSLPLSAGGKVRKAELKQRLARERG